MVEFERPLSGARRPLSFPTESEPRAAGEKADFFTFPGSER
jgi:hypothetical protein